MQPNPWEILERELGWAKAAQFDLSPLAVFTAAGFGPDDWQQQLLTAPQRVCLGVTSRQAGKTSCEAAIALSAAVNNPDDDTDEVIVVACPTFRQSARLLARCRNQWRRITKLHPDADLPRIINRDPGRILFDRGLPIVAMPDNPDGLRGETAHKIIVDEAAFVRRELWDVLTPMLAATGGGLIVLSSAGVIGTQMHDLWVDDGAPDTFRIEVPWDRIPRLSPVFIESERRRMTAARFAAEYECRWSSLTNNAFDWASIDRALIDGNPFDIPAMVLR